MKYHMRTIKGENHIAIVLRVAQRDEQGRPSLYTVIYPEGIANLKDPMQENEFAIAWVRDVMVEPHPEKAAQ